MFTANEGRRKLYNKCGDGRMNFPERNVRNREVFRREGVASDLMHRGAWLGREGGDKEVSWKFLAPWTADIRLVW